MERIWKKDEKLKTNSLQLFVFKLKNDPIISAQILQAMALQNAWSE